MQSWPNWYYPPIRQGRYTTEAHKSYQSLGPIRPLNTPTRPSRLPRSCGQSRSTGWAEREAARPGPASVDEVRPPSIGPFASTTASTP